MNESYKTIWNEALAAWVAVSEVSPGGRKLNRCSVTKALTVVTLSASAGMNVAHAQYEAGNWRRYRRYKHRNYGIR
jgi:hypothetical protein